MFSLFVQDCEQNPQFQKTCRAYYAYTALKSSDINNHSSNYHKNSKNITLSFYVQLRFKIYPTTQSQNLIILQGLISLYRVEKNIIKNKHTGTEYKSIIWLSIAEASGIVL